MLFRSAGPPRRPDARRQDRGLIPYAGTAARDAINPSARARLPGFSKFLSVASRVAAPAPSTGSAMAMNFASIAESVDTARTSKRQEIVNIGATLAFSTFWLLPRLAEFRALYPSAQIRVVSQDARFNLLAGEVDVIVRFGIPPFDDGTVVASRSDEVFPVCSPSYLVRANVTEQRFLEGRCDLIDHEVQDKSWYAWGDWFFRAGAPGLRTQPSLKVNNAPEAIQAARAGLGISMGWNLLINSFLEDGSLVRVGERAITAEGRYNVVVPFRRKVHPLRDIFTEWLASSLSR